jgi:hypothetical protein
MVAQLHRAKGIDSVDICENSGIGCCGLQCSGLIQQLPRQALRVCGKDMRQGLIRQNFRRQAVVLGGARERQRFFENGRSRTLMVGEQVDVARTNRALARGRSPASPALRSACNVPIASVNDRAAHQKWSDAAKSSPASN